MTDLLQRAGRWVRPPVRRHLSVFATLASASQAEAFLSVLAVVALARLAGVEEAGKVFFAQALASVWFLLCDPRLDDAALRFVPAHQATAPGSGTWLFTRLLRLDVLINLGATGVGAGAVGLAHALGWIPADLVPLLLLALVATGVGASAGTAGAGFIIVARLRRLGALRLATAGFSCVVTVAALAAGGTVAYLGASVLAGLVTASVLAVAGCREVAGGLGPAVPGDGRMPAGLVRFAAKSSAATSVAVATDSGVLALAGLLGGPALVTFIKVASAPGRLFTSLVSPVGSQLYPRLAAAVVARDPAAIRRDVIRVSGLLAVLGLVTVALAVPLAGPVLGLVYGPSYAALGAVAVMLLAAACVRGTVAWSKVLPVVLGWPGVRLAFVTGEGVLLLAVLVAATRLAGSAEQAALAFAWGALAVAVAGAATWVALLRGVR